MICDFLASALAVNNVNKIADQNAAIKRGQVLYMNLSSQPSRLESLLLLCFFTLVMIADGSASVLSDAAESLDPGQSIRITTLNLRNIVNVAGSGTTIISWGNTGVWCPFRNKAAFIGKPATPNWPYYYLQYDEETNRWDLDGDLHDDLEQNRYGHGFDHIALDSATGNLYFRPYGSDLDVYKYSRELNTWSLLPRGPGSAQVAEALEYWPGHGVVFSSGYGVKLWNGSEWSTPVERSLVESQIGYSSIGEVQPNADIYLFGAGNANSTKLFALNSNLSLRDDIQPSPIGLGNGSSYGQGILVFDPASNYFIAWDQESLFYQYDPIANSWSGSLAVCSNDGNTACDGAPNFTSFYANSIAISIPEYGVIMFVAWPLGPSGDDNQDYVWLYKHSPSSGRTPSPPSNLGVSP